MQVDLQKTFRFCLPFTRQDPEHSCKSPTAAPFPSALLSTLGADCFGGVNADMGSSERAFHVKSDERKGIPGAT